MYISLLTLRHLKVNKGDGTKEGKRWNPQTQSGAHDHKGSGCNTHWADQRRREDQ